LEFKVVEHSKHFTDLNNDNKQLNNKIKDLTLELEVEKKLRSKLSEKVKNLQKAQYTKITVDKSTSSYSKEDTESFFLLEKKKKLFVDQLKHIQKSFNSLQELLNITGTAIATTNNQINTIGSFFQKEESSLTQQIKEKEEKQT